MSTVGSRNLSWSMRCYKALLYVYPRTFRREFGSLLSQTFADMSQHAMQSNRFGAVAVLWTRVLRDLFSSAIDQRFPEDLERRFRWRWIAACGVGLPLGVLFLFALTFGPSFFLWMWHAVVHAGSSTVGRVLQRPLRLRPPRDTMLAVAEIAGVIALLPGWLQSRVFGWKAGWNFLWIVATIAGVSCGWAALYSVNSTNVLWASIVAYRPLVFPVSLLLCGVTIGLLQAAVLLYWTARAWLWIPTCAVAIVVAGYAVSLLETTMRVYTFSHPTLAGIILISTPLIGGTVFGALTAIPITWICNPKRSLHTLETSL